MGGPGPDAAPAEPRADPGAGAAPGGLALQLFLYALMCSIWGSSFFFTALALRSFNPVAVPVLRMAIATLILGIVVALRRLPLPRAPGLWMHVAVLGALNIAVPYILLNQAQTHVHSSLASVLSATTPLFAFLFSWLLARTERFSPLRAAGLVIAFGGVVLLYGFQRRQDGEIGPWSLVIVFCSALFAAGNVYTRRYLAGVHPFTVAFLQVGAGSAYLLAMGVASGELRFGTPSTTSLLAVLELGVAGSALTYVLFFHFIRLWGSTAASLNTYFQPLVGISLGVLVLKESIGAATCVSLAMVCCGVLIFGLGTLLSPRRPASRQVCAGNGHPAAQPLPRR